MKNEETENQNQQDSAEQNNNKVMKRYERIIAIVASVVGGTANLRPAKQISGDTTARIVADLFKEEQEQLEKDTKEGLRELLKKHVAMEREISEQRAKLDKLLIEKTKEFNEAADKWLKRIDQSAVTQEAYANSLKIAFAGPTELSSSDAPAESTQD